MREKNVSLKAIAARVGCSINTVSHALRDMSDISDETKVRIRKVAIEMGYMPNYVAQMMNKDERPVVGIFVNNMQNLCFTLFFDSLIAAFRRTNDYNLVLVCSEAFDCEMVKKCILQRVDVIVSNIACDEKTAEFARLNNINIVLAGGGVNINKEYVDFINVDNAAGCRLAARYLSKFHSGKKYIYVRDGYLRSDARYAEFRAELDNLESDPEVITFDITVDDTNFLYEKICEGYRNFFCFNDMIAYEILRRLDDLVVDVRRMFPDLHLVGFDGLCMYFPGLKQITTIGIDYSKYAEIIYGVVRDRIEKPRHPAANVIIPVVLHQRKK